MIEELNSIEVITPKPCTSTERRFWKIVCRYIGLQPLFLTHDSNKIILRLGFREILCERNPSDRKIGVLGVDIFNKKYSLLCQGDPSFQAVGNSVQFAGDIWAPLIHIVNLEYESEIIDRDHYGLVMPTALSKIYGIQRDDLSTDFLKNAIGMVISFLKIEKSIFRSVKQPFVALTFDLDGYYPGQIERALDLLDQYEISEATFMIMAPNPKYVTALDPQYSLKEDEIKKLFSSRHEIGLHTSYSAYDKIDRLIEEKMRLEDAAGRSIIGARNHYFKFAKTLTWTNQIAAGFTYDATIGFPDSPGFRSGTSLPIPFPHPDDHSKSLWTICTGILDQHLFTDLQNSECWKDLARDQIRRLEEQEPGPGVFCIDWHIHALEHPSFPNHKIALEYLIKEFLIRGFKVGSIQDALDSNISKYGPFNLSYLPKISEGESKITVDENEINSYIEAFHGFTNSAEYIDNSIDSFTSSLPIDAYTILEIGPGHGHFTRRIPPDREVICMDLDIRLMESISKKRIVGDICNIPFRDEQKFDLIMACDVIEHLSDTQLSKSVTELKRLSSKYVYLQAPFEEKLLAGYLKCGECGEVWNRNHHKQSFRLTKLMNLLIPEFIPFKVNFTGTVEQVEIHSETFYRQLFNSSEEYNLGPDIPCGNCGHIIKNINDQALKSYYNNLHSKFDQNLSENLPLYSEVGVWFIRKEYSSKSISDGSNCQFASPNQNRFTMQICARNEIEATKPVMFRDHYFQFGQATYLNVTNAYMKKTDDWIVLFPSSYSESANFNLCFANSISKCCELQFKGISEREALIDISFIASDLTLTYLGRLDVSGNFKVNFTLPTPIAGRKASFHFSVQSKGMIKFKSFRLFDSFHSLNNNEIMTISNGTSHHRHLEMIKNNITYRWFIPAQSDVSWSVSPEAWLTRKLDASGRSENNSMEVNLMTDSQRHQALQILELEEKIVRLQTLLEVSEAKKSKLEYLIANLEEQNRIAEIMVPKSMLGLRWYLRSLIIFTIERLRRVAVSHPLLKDALISLGIKSLFLKAKRKGLI